MIDITCISFCQWFSRKMDWSLTIVGCAHRGHGSFPRKQSVAHISDGVWSKFQILRLAISSPSIHPIYDRCVKLQLTIEMVYMASYGDGIRAHMG